MSHSRGTYQDYLLNLKSQNQDHTHTRIGSKDHKIYGGSYTIINENDFYKKYYKHIFVNGGKEYLTEKQIENGQISNTQSLPISTKYPSEKVKTDEKQERELFKIDYVLPFDNDGQFELGFRRSNSYINTDYLVEDENLNGQFIKNTNLSNELFYNEKVNAFYSQYGNKKNKIS